MPTPVSRRRFLRFAGGVTFLALVPVGRGVFAAPAAEGSVRLPLFTVLPYIQPGPNSALADGILYIVTGAGGKHLYDADFTDNPARWTHADAGHADYVVKMVTDRHSLSLFEVDGAQLTMAQIDEAGQEFDRITVTKSARPATG